MHYWMYEAFDANFKIAKGVLIADTSELVVLNLRQRGQQVIRLQSITHAEYMREQYLQRLKAKTGHSTNT